MIEQFVNQLLPKIYSCIQHPHRWISILDELREKLEVESVAAQVFELTDGYHLKEVWLVRDSQSLINAELHDKWVNNPDNPRMDYDFSESTSIIRDEERFADNPSKYIQFQERLAQAGLGLAISLEMKMSPNRYLNFIAHRKHGDNRTFGKDCEELFLILAPHIQQTIQLYDQFQALSTRHTIIQQTSDKLSTGILLVDHHGKVTWSNSSASNIISASEYLDLVDNELRFRNKADKTIFLQLLSQAQSNDTESYPLARLGEHQNNPIQLLMTPIRPSAPMDLIQPRQPVTFALFISNHNEVTLSEQNIGRLFGLTPAEVKLANALANGLSLADYSAEKGISIGTARIQLKSVFSKMGVTRQPELVKTLWSSILPHVNPFSPGSLVQKNSSKK